jgi:hypothetical protein
MTKESGSSYLVEGQVSNPPFRANAGAFLADARFAIEQAGVHKERSYAR